jgi:excinuclease ABC subunit B
MAYNQKHGIEPKSVLRPVQESLSQKQEKVEKDELAVSEKVSAKELKKMLRELEKEMLDAVKKLEFEKAALLRDQIEFLKGDGDSHLKAITKGGYTGKKTYGRRKYGKRK